MKNGTFQFLSGSMDLGSTPLTLGAGDTFTLGAGSTFVNTGSLSIDPGSTFVINGGTFSAGSVSLNGGSFDFTSGQLNLTNSDLVIGTGGLLGNNVTLDATRQISVSGNAVVESGATLSLNGGTLAVDALTIAAGGTLTGQGIFSGTTIAVNGNLNLTGNTDILSGGVVTGDFFTAGGTGLISIADGTTTRFYSAVFVNGEGITVGAGGEAIYYGYVGGSGTLGGAGTHRAAGTVGPGNSPGLLTVENDFVFENTATLMVEINGLPRGPGDNDPGYDAMNIGGDAWLDGTLDVGVLNGFAPSAGNSFDILSAMVVHGTFDATVLPTLGNNLRWEVQYLLNEGGMDTVRLSVETIPIPDADADGVADTSDNCSLVSNPTQLDADGDGYGNICDADINNSGTVTTADFGLLRSVLGQPASFSATAAAADMNGSGTVTTADFGLLRARLGTAPGPSGLACAGTVPCP